MENICPMITLSITIKFCLYIRTIYFKEREIGLVITVFHNFLMYDYAHYNSSQILPSQCVDFGEAGKPGRAEKSPRSTGEIN